MVKMPNYFRVEGPQVNLKVRFGDNPIKYFKNSPIHFAQDYKSAVLLWTGLQDDNVDWKQTQHMYIALQRYRQPVIALFYKKEDHNLLNRTERLDLTYRILDWFNYYLKESEKMEWIDKGVDYQEY